MQLTPNYLSTGLIDASLTGSKRLDIHGGFLRKKSQGRRKQ